jgi:hypothetical protein
MDQVSAWGWYGFRILVLGYLAYRVAKVIDVNMDRRAVKLREEREAELRR